MRLYSTIAIAVLTTLLLGCQAIGDLEDLESAQYEAEYAVPLIDARFSLRETLENFEDLNTIYVDEEGVIHFQYFGDLLTQNSDTLFERINNQIGGIPIPVTSKRMPLQLGGAGLEFDRLEFKGGHFIWGLQNQYDEVVEVTLTLPEVKKDGEPIVLNQTVGEMGTFTNAFVPFDLTGYDVITDPVTDSIYVEYELLRADGTPGEIGLLFISFDSLEFEYMEGFMGIEAHKGVDIIEIDFFDDWIKGDIYFADPRVTFLVENSFGVPTRSKVNEFEVYTVTGDTLQLTGDYVDEGIDFPYPTLDQVGQIATGGFEFNKNNSNIDEILGAGPLAIYYDVDAVTNPDSNTTIRGFITDDSYYDVTVEVDLPLYGTAVDFLAKDTFELSFGEYENVDRIEFKMVAENELPLDVRIQGYFLDADGVVLDSLFTERSTIIAAAEVDEAGNALGAKEQITFIDFPAERLDKVRDTERLSLSASFFTTDDGRPSVTILDKYNLSVRMGAILGVTGEE